MSLTVTALAPTRAISAGDVVYAAKPSVTVYVDSNTREPETQLHYGEPFTVLENRGLWLYGHAANGLDHGFFVRRADMVQSVGVTHRVVIPLAPVYTAPDTRSTVVLELPMNARVGVRRESSERGWTRIVEGYVASSHIGFLYVPIGDTARIASLFLGTPYRWGGRSYRGIDCSGLIKEAVLMSHRLPAKHSANWMAEHLGEPLPLSQEPAHLQRNDLVFWDGHVALMLDERRAIHAAGGDIKLTVEQKLADIIRDRNKKKKDPIRAFRRLPPPMP